MKVPAKVKVFLLKSVGQSLYMSSKKSFLKPALSIDEQISLLESRGLCVEDREYARKVLSNVNYYHLKGDWYPFYDKSKQDHFFYDDVHLSQIFWRVIRRSYGILITAIRKPEYSLLQTLLVVWLLP